MKSIKVIFELTFPKKKLNLAQSINHLHNCIANQQLGWTVLRETFLFKFDCNWKGEFLHSNLVDWMKRFSPGLPLTHLPQRKWKLRLKGLHFRFRCWQETLPPVNKDSYFAGFQLLLLWFIWFWAIIKEIIYWNQNFLQQKWTWRSILFYLAESGQNSVSDGVQ